MQTTATTTRAIASAVEAARSSLDLSPAALTPLQAPMSFAMAAAAERTADLVTLVREAITNAPSRPMRVMQIEGALETAHITLEGARQIRVGTSDWSTQVHRGAALVNVATDALTTLERSGDVGSDLLLDLAATHARTTKHAADQAVATRIDSSLAHALSSNTHARTLLLGWLADQAPAAKTHVVATSLLHAPRAHGIEATIATLAHSAIEHLDDGMRVRGGTIFADAATKRGLAVQRSAQAYRDLALMRELLSTTPDAASSPRLRTTLNDTQAALDALRARMEFDPGGLTGDIARSVASMRTALVHSGA